MASTRQSFLVFIVVVFVSSCRSHSIKKRVAQDDGQWTDIAEKFIEAMVADIINNNGSYIAIHDINVNFGGKILDGRLKATEGLIGNLTTVRFVNVTVSTTPDSFTVFVQTRLDELEIVYRHFEASVRFLSVSGSFRAAVDSNLLTAQVTRQLKGDDCNASLDKMEISELGGIRLTILDVGIGNGEFIDNMATMMINKFIPELQNMAKEKLKELILPYVSLACEL